MTASRERPKFGRALITSVGKSFDQRGYWAVFPSKILACAAAGSAVAYLMPLSFWPQDSLPVSVVVYVGLLTLNGLVLALSWSAFARIHECISNDNFGAYLMERDLLGDYILYIDYAHIAQLAAIITSASGLFILLYNAQLIWERAALGAMVATSIYAIACASGAVTVMHDLIWQRAIFLNHEAAKEQEQGDENTTPQSTTRVIVVRRGNQS